MLESKVLLSVSVVKVLESFVIGFFRGYEYIVGENGEFGESL